ncbi:MAG: hypothetical protein ACPG5B_11550 [Chitinophagales bacterium]
MANIILLQKSATLRKTIKQNIEEQYGNLNQFCISNKNYDYSDIHKFLKGERDWGLAKVCALLQILKLNVSIK